MHTIHGPALVPVQSLFNLIATQCSIREILRQCSDAFLTQSTFAKENARDISDTANGRVGLDVDPPVRPGMWLCPDGGHDINATDGA